MKALVTGGGGFLGGAIVRQLRERGDVVRTFSRGAYPELQRQGVDVRCGDLADANAVSHAVKDCDCVFHVAAKAGVWGPRSAYQRANVTGTENVLAACQRHGVPRLVYTSSPSIVFDGNDMEGVDESAPYAEHFEAHYPHTKMLAERAVLAANSPTLATVALRPHLIWGPGDNHLVPRILEKGRRGQLRRIGKDNKLIDSVYIDDAARAHLLAADRLRCEPNDNQGGTAPAGKAYFITQGEPVPLWDLVNRILDAAGLPPVTRSVHRQVAYAAGWVLEGVHRTLRLKSEPRMTRFVARELSTAHWFDISAAKRDLGYEPSLTIDKGMERLGAALRETKS